MALITDLKTDKDPKETMFKLQRLNAREDVYTWVRQYLAIRAGNPSYAIHGPVFGQDEIALIEKFADMLVDIVND